jgi:hypothetical protein
MFNGSGRNTTTNDNNEFMYVGRLEAQLFAGKLAGLDASAKIGGDCVNSRDDKGTNVTPAGNVLVAKDGSLSAFILPSAGQREAYGIDASLHLGPFDLVAEYLDEKFSPRTAAGVAPAFTQFEPHGYYVTGRYFILPKKLQLVARWESFDADQVADDNVQSITGGLNYYIAGDDEFNQIFVRLQVMF